MNVCYKCRKPVYFAERKTSLGKEWHPNCLRCEQCEKIVTPGQHAEHKGIPYCNPCYQALFGPQMVGYGSNVFSQANYRRSQCVPLKQDEFSNGPRLEQSRQQLLNKVQAYNSFYEGKRGKLTVNEKNGSLMIEGPLRVYWQVTKPIQLKHCDDVPVPPIANWRHSYYAAIDNGLADEEQVKPHHLEMPFAKKGFDDSLLSPTSDGVVMRRRNIRKSNTVAYRAERPNKWKRASINGHIYNYDTRVFTPVIGSCTSVTVNNFMTVPSVIKTLLDKFKVENEASEFSLFVVTEHKEKRQLSDNDLPLLERLSLGPIESVAKIFLSEKEAKMQQRIVPEVEEQIVSNIAEEESCKEDGSQELSIVEQLMALPEAVLKGLLQKFMNDEEKEVAVIRARYEKARSIMQQQISEIQTSV